MSVLSRRPRVFGAAGGGNGCVRALVLAQSEDIAVKARHSFPAAGFDGVVVEGNDPDGPAALAQPHTN